MSQPRHPAFGVVTGGLLTALLVAGCAAPGPAPGHSSAGSSRPALATAAAGSSPAAVVVSTSSITAAGPTATASPVPPSTVAAVAPTAAPRSTCRSLMIRVIRGSAAPGFEFAALQFVNTGTTRCVLNGYPTVSLLRGGAPVGSTSLPSSAATSTYSLAPGDTAESRLKDFSDCQAPLSDQIRVVAPGSSATVTRPGQLRACTLRVYPLAAPE